MLRLQLIDLEAANKETVVEQGGVVLPPEVDARAITGRVNNTIDYGQITTMWELAAFYCEAIAKTNAFRDGNKRTAAIFCNMLSLLTATLA